MTRIIWATFASVAVFAAVSASAATIGGITTQDVGADNQAVISCDTDGVTTDYVTAYEDAIPGYEVTTLTVGGIHDNCNTLTMKVTLAGAADAALAEQTVTVAVNAGGGDSDDDLDFSADNVLAEDVTAVYVSIVG